MARAKPTKSSTKISESPVFWICTPGGSRCSEGNCSTSAITSPSGRPLSSAVKVMLRWRPKRLTCDGPLPRRISATAASGTVPPLALGTRSRVSRSWSDRFSSARRTRIGTWRSGRLSLARRCRKSPLVAMRAASAMSAVDTPRSAARRASGTITSSGRSSDAVELTVPRPCSERRSRSNSPAARYRRSGSSPLSTSISCSPGSLLRNRCRTPGSAVSRSRTSRSSSFCDRSRSPSGPQSSTIVTLRTSPKPLTAGSPRSSTPPTVA